MKKSTTRAARNSVKGARIKYDGNPAHDLDFFNAQGIPLTQNFFEYAISNKFLWSVVISFHFKSKVGLMKVVETELKTDQAIQINDLSQHIEELKSDAAKEVGEFWEYDHKEWVAKIVH